MESNILVPVVQTALDPHCFKLGTLVSLEMPLTEAAQSKQQTLQGTFLFSVWPLAECLCLDLFVLHRAEAGARRSMLMLTSWPFPCVCCLF